MLFHALYLVNWPKPRAGLLTPLAACNAHRPASGDGEGTRRRLVSIASECQNERVATENYALHIPNKVSGGPEQIRTADLSLRRRPLYPTELRARSRSIVAFQAPFADVFSVVHAVKMDLVHGRVSRCRCSAFRSAPDAVTPSTRPPAVTRSPPSRLHARLEDNRILRLLQSR